MTAATITTRENVFYVDFTPMVTAPHRQRRLWRRPWWWPAELRDRLARCERKVDNFLGVLSGWVECPS